LVNTPLIKPKQIFFHNTTNLNSKILSKQHWIYVLKIKIPRIRDAKTKEGAFVGPQIRVNTGHKI
jgi:hypothetical protein